jgi:predicted flap endonuclease-1-like 5' DNA nuclease
MPRSGLAAKAKPPIELGELRNIGKAMLRDFKQLGIVSVSQLATQNADEIYTRLSVLTGARQDPCVHDTFAAAIHQAKTGEALNWWAFTPQRKERQKSGTFPKL